MSNSLFPTSRICFILLHSLVNCPSHTASLMVINMLQDIVFYRAHKPLSLNKLLNCCGVCRQTHTHRHNLSPQTNLGCAYLARCACSCVADWVQWIFAQFIVCNCVEMRLCLCARLCLLIPQSFETWPDGAWRLAVFIVTELMMLFMKFIDLICMAPRVPPRISLSVCLPLP